MSVAASSALVTRAERRKRETRERLLAAALEVFRRRGFDASTTAEITEAADLGAGTFYLHFKDKRDVFETLCRRAAREVIDRWRERVRAKTPLAESVALALECAAEFWSADRERARLLLDGGPTFGSEAHLRLVETFARLVEAEGRGPRSPSAEVASTIAVGLAIELGRVIVARSPAAARRIVNGTVAWARHTLSRG